MKLIFGDSHLGALNLGAQQLELDCNIQPNHGQNLIGMDITTTGNTLHLYADNVQSSRALDLTLTQGDRVVFSGPLHSSVVSRHRLWRSSAPWSMHATFLNHQLVSGNFIKTVAQHRTASMMQFLVAAKAIGIEVAVLEPPRPSRRALKESSVDQVIMVHVDHTYRDEVRALIEATGTPVIDTPAQTHDGQFMLEMYQAVSETDVHHGNKNYGVLAVEQAVQFLDVDVDQPADPATRKTALQRLLKA